MFDLLCSVDTHTSHDHSNFRFSLAFLSFLLHSSFSNALFYSIFIVSSFVCLNDFLFLTHSLFFLSLPGPRSRRRAPLVDVGIFLPIKRTTDRKYINFLPYPLPLLNFSDDTT